MSNDQQQGHPMLHDGGQFVGLVANPLVMRDRDPAARSDNAKPLGIGRPVAEVVEEALDAQTGFAQASRELLAQVTIGEVDAAGGSDGVAAMLRGTQAAALSYSAACSISAGVSS